MHISMCLQSDFYPQVETVGVQKEWHYLFFKSCDCEVLADSNCHFLFFFLSFCGFPGLEVGDEINIGCGLWYRVLMLGAISSHHFRGKISADEPLLFLLESSEQKVLTEYVPIVKGLKTLLMLSLWLAWCISVTQRMIFKVWILTCILF